MSSFLERIGDSVSSAKHNAHDLAKVTKAFAEEKLIDIKYVDVEIQFIGASNIPKMDAFGLADPYFVASLHSHIPSDTSSLTTTTSNNSNYTLKDKDSSRISFVSSVQPHTLTPVWNEIWRVLNVPSTSDLQVEVLDKDLGSPRDDYIGKFKVSISPGAKEAEIEGSALVGLVGRRDRGTFWLKITSRPAVMSPTKSTLPAFLFAGPIRYSIHFSPTVGLLTNLPDARLYCTWKMYLVGVGVWFRERVQEGGKDENQNQNGDENEGKEVPPKLPPRPSQRIQDPEAPPLPPRPTSTSFTSSSLPNPYSPPSSPSPQPQQKVTFRPLIQHWNTSYKAAQSIFGSGPTSFAVRQGVMAGHRMLYARSTRNGFGVLGGGARGVGNGRGNGNGNGDNHPSNDTNTPEPGVGRPTPEEVHRIGEDLKRLLRGSVNENPNVPVRQGGGGCEDKDDGSGSLNANANNANNNDGNNNANVNSSNVNNNSNTSNSNSNSNSKSPNRIKPTVYTYIISAEDDSFRFSETGAAFFVDFASKHALHANCSEGVRYSGEFHPRPRILDPQTGHSLGWAGFNDHHYPLDDDIEWELVFDNNSGTYAPSKKLLGRLKGLMEGNLCGGEVVPWDERKYDLEYEELTRESLKEKKSPSGFHIVVYDREDPRLEASVKATREYALKWRGVRKEEFVPTVHEGEVTLMQKVSTRRGGGRGRGDGDGKGGEKEKEKEKEKLKSKLYRLDSGSSSTGTELERRRRVGEMGVEGYDDDEEGEEEEDNGNDEDSGNGGKGVRVRERIQGRVEERMRKMGIGK